MTTVLFIGRWQPFHDGHHALIMEAVKEGHHVVVGIRDTKNNAGNPFSYWWRKRRIAKALGENVGAFVRIPDPDCDLEVWIGRKVGYKVVQLSEDLQTISGTAVREEMRKQGRL